MKLDDSARHFILQLIAQVPDMTLATVRADGYPQATTVSYANDGLTLYVGIGLGSQKAHNIQHNDKVSLSITAPYSDWQHIRGLSMAARATIVAGREEAAHAAECLLRRFPQIRQVMATTSLPWPGALVVRIEPVVISVLDYEKGFGHTDVYEVMPDRPD